MITTEYFKNGFGEYIENKRFSDVKLVCGDKVYHTHRIILAYSSEFFARLLLSEFRESSQTVIELKQPDPFNVFSHVLCFMYNGKILISPENVIPLLSMADLYLIKDLNSICTKYLELNLHRENVLTVLRSSIEFHFDEITQRCITILCKNFPFVCENSLDNSNQNNNSNNSNSNEEEYDFSFLPPRIFYRILKHPYLVVKSEYTLYKIVLLFINSYNNNQNNNNQNNNQDIDDSKSTTSSTSPIIVQETEIQDNIKVSDLLSQIRYIWMTFDQLKEVSNNPLIPKEILFETFLERLKKYENNNINSQNNNSGTKLIRNLSHSTNLTTTTTTTNHNTVITTITATLPNQQQQQQVNSETNQRLLPRPPQSILFEYTFDFDNKGVFYWIATNGCKHKWINPHLSNKIKITSSSVDKGNVYEIVGLVPCEFWTKDVPASWVMIDLGPNRALIPMCYTIRHGLSFKSDSLRTWDFQGSQNGEQWTVLKRHTNDLSLNLKYATFSWPIQGVEIAYRYFRILQTGKNSNNRNFLVIGGLEVYGELLQLDNNNLNFIDHHHSHGHSQSHH